MKKILFMLAVTLSITGCDEKTQTTTNQEVCPIIDKGMSAINLKEVADNIEKYNTMLKNDNTVDICVYAGKVKQAYLNAKDNSNYEIWSKIEKSDCKNAGL